MYRVLLRTSWDTTPILIHSDSDESDRLVSVKITKSTDSYDSLDFTIDPTHKAFNKIIPYRTFITVVRTKPQRTLFEGRVLTIQPSMDNGGVINKAVTAEGLEGFLHDSVQPWAEFHNTTPKAFLQSLIDNHNAQVEDYKKIILGSVTVTNSTDNVYCYTDDTKDTFDTIKDKLITSMGGEIRIRHESNGLYLDYEPTIGELSNQIIRLQSNLMSLTQKIDPTTVITQLKPLGATQQSDISETGTAATSSPRLTISNVNNGSPFLIDERLIKEFGIQTGVQTWDDVTTDSALLTKGKAFLNSQATASQQVQLNAVDLSLIKKDVDDFICGDSYHIINPLLGFDQTLRAIGQTIDICDPTGSGLTFGDAMLSQEEYNQQMKQSVSAAKTVGQKVTYLEQQAVRLSNASKEANKSLETLRNDYDQLIKSVGDADFASITTQLTELKNQTATAIANLGEIGAEVLTNQNAIADLKIMDAKLDQRISALEGNNGGTTNE